MPIAPSFHAPLTPPRSSITMTELRVAVLRAAEDGLPLPALPAWLNAYDSARGPMFGDRPIDLLVMVMGTRRADLLATVLDVPAFCPTETRLDRRSSNATGDARVEVVRREARHGRDLFNGGLDVAALMPGEPGEIWVEARVSVARHADGLQHEPTSRAPDPFGFRPDRRDTSRTRLDAQDPLRQVPAAMQQAFDVQSQRQARALGGHGFPEAYRRTGATNLLGLAVMMGWDEGLKVLLDRGVDPYAHVGKRQAQASPLLLAGVYGEAACATMLLQHPSFKPLARYGYTEAETARRQSTPDDRGTPWSERTEWGGFDLVFVLENPALMAHTAVRDALAPRLTPTVVKRLTGAADGLSVVARRALERLVLENTLHELDGAPAPAERSRARL